MKLAFMFPGQGAQVVGMGKDICEKYKEADAIYETASQVLQKDIKKLCFESTVEELSKTENTQIAIAVTSLAILEILKSKNIQAEVTVGLSLGEYVSLIYGEYLDLKTGLELLQKRGYLMGHFVPKEEFAMAAVIGLEANKIEKVCQEVKKKGLFVVPANYNYSGQTVISGEKEAVLEAEILLKEQGARKVVLLKTSGPFHTSKLEKAKKEYEKELAKVSFQKGNEKVIVLKNLDGTAYQKEDDFKEILANHIIKPVHFDLAIQEMKKREVDTFVEIGPGKTLTGFLKKELPTAAVWNLSNVEQLEEFLTFIKEEKENE